MHWCLKYACCSISPTIVLVWGRPLPRPQSKWFSLSMWAGPGILQILNPESLLPLRPNLATKQPGVSIFQIFWAKSQKSLGRGVGIRAHWKVTDWQATHTSKKPKAKRSAIPWTSLYLEVFVLDLEVCRGRSHPFDTLFFDTRNCHKNLTFLTINVMTEKKINLSKHWLF